MTRDYSPILTYEPKVDPRRCKASVWESVGSGSRNYQCNRKPKRDGYCTQHHPNAEKERRAKREAKWDLERRQRNTAWEVDDAERLVVDCALELKVFTDGPESRAFQKALDRLRKAKAERQAALEEKP